MTEPSHPPSDLNQLWREVIDQLQQQPDIPAISPQQRAYLHLAHPAAVVEGIAVISVPNSRTKELIERDLGEHIRNVLSAKLGKPMTLAVSVTPMPEHDQHAQQPSQPQHTQQHSQQQPNSSQFAQPEQPRMQPPQQQQQYMQQSAQPQQPAPQEHFEYTPNPGVQPQQPAEYPASQGNEQWNQWTVDHTPEQIGTAPTGGYQRETPAHNPNRAVLLNPAYTFDNYVVSDNNKLPFSAAIAVAEKPARSYNPLFIWGDSGLGKTHLMHAIGNYAQQLQPNLKIKYVSSEEFTNDYINSVRDDRQESFKRRYRDLDILMVDDIQFLQGKEGTQEEFFHTFNALQQANKQIVLSSDRPPKQLTTLEDRLRTRFQSGLIADIYPPDLETRIAILSKKAQADGVAPDREVMEMIASRFNTSIRELEGAYIRVSAYASLNKQPITVAAAEIALRDMMPEQAEVEVTAESIMEVTAEYFNIAVSDLTSTKKARAIAHARQLAMYLCRELTDLSLPRIGEHFGKDHTTVMYADRKIRAEITEKRDTYDEIQKLTQQIKSISPR